MSKVLKAADEVRKLTKMFQALGDVVEVLDRVGSVEQAEQESLARVEKLNAEVAKAKEAISVAHGEASQLIAMANDKSDELLSVAEQSAADLLKSAEAIVAEANARADAILATGKLGVENMAAEVAAAIGKRDKALEEAIELEKRADKARAYLAKLQG